MVSLYDSIVDSNSYESCLDLAVFSSGCIGFDLGLDFFSFEYLSFPIFCFVWSGFGCSSSFCIYHLPRPISFFVSGSSYSIYSSLICLFYVRVISFDIWCSSIYIIYVSGLVDDRYVWSHSSLIDEVFLSIYSCYLKLKYLDWNVGDSRVLVSSLSTISIIDNTIIRDINSTNTIILG